MSRYVVPTPEMWRDPRPGHDTFNGKYRAGYNPHYSQVGDPSGHDGVDFSSRFRTRSVAVAGGKVHFAGAKPLSNPSAGKYVEIVHEFFVGPLEMSRSLHHDEVTVVTGQIVEQGEQIGYVGHTGLASYDHVHLGILQLRGGYRPDKSGVWHVRNLGAVWLDPIAEGILDGEPAPSPDPITVEVTRPPLLTYGPPYGDPDDNVRDYQADLARRGYLEWYGNNSNGVFDGQAGPRTRRGVEAFQSANGLPVTGVIDELTLSALGSYP